jgi:antitoxin component YwqK of YwqJK toxin-antitoxin module
MLKKEEMTKFSIKDDYYVYGLIDPRTNKTVYIGKGRGKRRFSHTSLKNKTSNKGKYELIEEINKIGLKLESKIIRDNLKKKTALDLEKILIYRTGRLAFDEGILVNYSPGGNWNKGDSFFLRKQDLPMIHDIEKEIPDIANILQDFPDVSNNSKINSLIWKDGSIYATKFNLQSEDEGFIKLESPVLIVNLLKSEFPIFYRNCIFSLQENIRPESVDKIPFEDYDEVNYSFVKKVNFIITNKKTERVMSVFSSKSKYAELNIVNGLLNGSFIVFYNTGQKKHESHFEENTRIGISTTYFENGNKETEKLYDSDGELEKAFKYYPNGIIESERYYLHLEDEDIQFQMFFDNGQIRSRTLGNQDFVVYFITGEIMSKGNYKNGTTRNYYKNGILRFLGERIDGNWQGLTKEWFDTGNIKKTCDYTNGLKNRVETYYRKNGNISKKINY